MKEQGHLKTYDIILTAKSPVFIGSGVEYNKKEYYYDRARGKVHIINIPSMISLLCSKNLVDEYENYMLTANYDLYQFFTKCKITASELDKITLYTVNVGNALVQNRTLAGIMQFIRDQNGRPYIPGSSLKGALRTVILQKLISEEKKEFAYKMQTKDFEKLYFNTLNLYVKKPNNEVNSIMRGISISDSEAIDPNRIILTRKTDFSVYGKNKEINNIREAISPNTTIHFTMTLDESIHSCLNIDFIRNAINEYGRYYNETYQKSFHLPSECIKESYENCIVLGGGSGYFGKNIMYPLLGKQEAVKQVSLIMQKNFRKHYHDRDIALGISPHMLKYTQYQNRYYHYGVCQVDIS